jgi:hypothetical protein
MDSALVAELRSITAAALTATSAAERSNWGEAAMCVADLGARVKRVQRQISSTGRSCAVTVKTADRACGTEPDRRHRVLDPTNPESITHD